MVADSGCLPRRASPHEANATAETHARMNAFLPMAELTLDDRVAIPENVVAREVDGETVLLNLDTGIYFGLDAVGTAIWRAIQAHGQLHEAAAAVEREYDVDPAVLRTDLLRLISQMLAKGLLQNL